MNNWKNFDVYVYPHTLSSSDPFFHGLNGVGGVTDPTKMKLYVRDTKSSYADLENFLMVSHEIGHAILMWFDFSQRKAMRNDDYSGNKKGELRKAWTQEVHDRHIEKNIETYKFWFHDWKTKKSTNHLARVIKIKDLLI